MKQPIFSIPKKFSGHIRAFSGVEVREKLDTTALHSGKNLSSRLYPYLSTRPPREVLGSLSGEGDLQGILSEQEASLDALTFVRGGVLYYRGEAVSPDAVLGRAITEGEKQILDFDGKIFIFPDALYYDYTAARTDPSEGLKTMDHTFNMDFSVFTSQTSGSQMVFYYNSNLVQEQNRERYRKRFEEFKVGDFLLVDNRGDVRNFKTMKSVEEEEHRYAQESDWTQFQVMRRRTSGSVLYMHTSIRQKDGTAVTFDAPNSGIVWLHRHIPEASAALGVNNRLWLVKGNRLFVSGDGNPMSFNQFQERGSDSFTKRLADRGGDFVGLGTVNGKVVVFKESTMYQIYGNDALNYAAPYTIDKGCIDRRSIVNLDSRLYFLAKDGVYRFDGSKLESVGLPKAFHAGQAQTDGRRYYLLAEPEDGNAEMWVYDTACDLWYNEDAAHLTALMRFGKDVCAITDEQALLRFGSGEEFLRWEMETKPITGERNERKRPKELFLRLRAKPGSTMDVWIKTNREPVYRRVTGLLCDRTNRISPERIRIGTEIETVTVPLSALPCDNFSIRLTGTGEWILYEAEHRYQIVT